MVNPRSWRIALLLAVLGLAVVSTIGAAWAWEPWINIAGSCQNSSSNNNYWSGTNAIARANWFAGSGNGLTKVELWVNNVKLYEKTFTGTHPQNWPLDICDWVTAPFSTTQFYDAAELVIKGKLWTDGTPSYEEATWEDRHEYKIYARNVSYALYCLPGCDYRDENAMYAAVAFGFSNHTTYGPYGTHSAATIESYLDDRQVFHMSGHASSSTFGDCRYDLTSQPPKTGNEYVTTAAEVSSAIANRDANDPGFNFVFIDGCNSAADWTLKSGFDNNGQAKLQCYLGWDGFIADDDDHRHWVQVLYDKLMDECSLALAQAFANAAEESYDHSAYPAGHGAYQLHKTY